MCIHDDPERIKLLQAEWDKYGGCLTSVLTAQEVIEVMSKKQYHLIAIAADCVKSNLQPTIKAIRNATDMPIVVMPSKYNRIEMVASLRIGADEYIPIPGTVEESIMIGYALIGRYCDFEGNRKKENKIAFQGIQIDIPNKKVFAEGRTVHLTRGEFQCLSLLMSNPGRVFEYDMLYYASFGEAAQAEYNLTSLRSLIRRVRLKVGPEHSKYIESVRGTGYRWGVDA